MPTTQQSHSSTVPLLVIAAAQLMLVLDDSIVNIALPSIRRELGVAPEILPWVVNAYILAFGALLLLGGRIGDLWGQRRALQSGLAIFTAASLLGGLGQSPEMLIAARAVQGVGAALTAPNALALITTTFRDRTKRDRALALYGAMSGLGIVLGLLLGGVLTDLLDWRWVFFINIPIGLLVLAGSRTLVPAAPRSGRLGAFGAVLGTAGMVTLVSAITRLGDEGFSSPDVYGLLGAAVVLLVAFVRSQRSSRSPLVPLGLFRDRARSGAYATMLGLAIGPMGTFYIITLYLQEVRMVSPLIAGVSWLPFALGIILGAGLAPKLLLRVAPRWIAAVGAILGAAGAFWLSRITLDTVYWTGLAPAMLLIAVGFGLGVVALTQAAVYRAEPDEAGVASGLLNSAQQIGVALGLAILAGVATAVTSSSPAPDPQALVDGHRSALTVGAAVLGATAILATVALRGRAEAGTGTPSRDQGADQSAISPTP
ncbi:MFS transporter [Nesterenkonia halophila]